MGRELDHFFNHNNFKKINNITYGVYKKYLVSFSTLPGMIKLSIELAKNINDDSLNEISKKLDEISFNYKNVKSATFGYLSIDILFIQSLNIDETIMDILNMLIYAMQNNHIPCIDTCPICNRSLASNEPIIKIGTVVYQIHEPCLKTLQALEQFQNKKVTYKKVEKKSYLLGVIGAIIGVVVFSIIWILSYSSSTAIGLLMIPMFILSKYLYEICRGKKDGKEIYILLICNIIGLIVSIVCGFTNQMCEINQSDFVSELINLFSNLTIMDNFKFFLGHFLIGSFCLTITYGILKSLFKYRIDSTSKIEIIK